uniref:major pollen allergen Art v 1-like n=1 Tax=Erigeron canadensis TaxID=72917 RepID=UPI001CB9588A|nr:major pollen allergen Art v 1-like [Erigeron canadensis]
MAKGSFAFLAGILFLFVIAISEIEAGGAPKLCEKSSQTFTGKCDNKECDKKCMKFEKAIHGTCHKREGKDGCFCYYDCATAPPSKDTKPAPPGLVPPPTPSPSPSPPAEGGGDSPPPPAEGGGDSPPPPSTH